MQNNLAEIDKRNAPIGFVVGGGLKENLFVRLTVPANEVQEGAFVVIKRDDWRFYGLVVDLQLGASEPRYAENRNESRFSGTVNRLLAQQTLYTNLVVLPALMIEEFPELGDPAYPEWRAAHPEDPAPMPIKTIPAHHSNAWLASADDVATIFGAPGEGGNFVIGSTREQNHPVCIDLDSFVKRSSGIFGATGSGKSFLTRMVLAGLIQRDKVAVLVYDMHNEYGFDDTSSDTGKPVAGLKGKFQSKVRVVAIGRNSTIRDQMPDFHLELRESDIQPEDIEMLTGELNLRETTSATLDGLLHSFDSNRWFHEFKEMKVGLVIENEDGKKVPAPGSVAYWANEEGVNAAAAEGLHHKLHRVFNLPYVIPDANAVPGTNLSEVIKALQNGQHIILSFGEYERDLDYLLVSNLLTRKIREAWEKTTNDFRSHGGKEPRPLVIAVEEAHKLLNREMAAQTSFSTIAREMRKYYVTLLIIDQRPSQIYDEVMSQLGTRISGSLGDEDDIAAVLSGQSGRDALRSMLSRLQPKEEILLLGWGVPMPILVRSRRYDDAFWKELQPNKTKLSAEQSLKDLGF